MPRNLASPSPDDKNYLALLDGLKNRIRIAQIDAALAVNQKLIKLYWYVGKEILARQKEQKWGSKVVDRISQDLKREFPNIKGFSRSNLMYMRAFAEAWESEQIVQGVLDNLPWSQNIALLEKLTEQNERLWYAQQAIENGWSRNVLVAQVETRLYQREGGAVTNFERTLPPVQSDLAKQIVKDPYHFDFLTIEREAKEEDLKRALVKHMRDFLLELGVGFSFVGRDYRLDVNGEEFFVDMLFYHLKLRCYVAIQLEMGDFKPEHSGRMNFYISAIDAQEREEHDQPTIGTILCKTKNKTVAEYALGNLRNPIAITTHRLPSPEQLQSELDVAAQLLAERKKEES
jgi:predicted nuclease of restriction endonuclease-like (RecB) superfamily